MEKYEWTQEELAVRRKRSIAIAIILVALMCLFFITTIVRIGGNIAAGAS